MSIRKRIVLWPAAVVLVSAFGAKADASKCGPAPAACDRIMRNPLDLLPCGEEDEVVVSAAPPDGASEPDSWSSAEASLAKGQPVEVLVVFDPPLIQTARSVATESMSEDPVAVAKDERAARVRAVIRDMPSVKQAFMTMRAEGDGVELVQDYESLPAVYARIHSLDALHRLRAAENVQGVHLPTRFYQSLVQSRARVHQPNAEAAGYIGQGTAIAIVDSGIEYTHDAFGPCSAPGAAAGNQRCRVVVSRDFGYNDGQGDDSGHGTAVAGVATAMAPGADLISLDVFRRNLFGTYATTQDIVASLNWVVANATTYNIVTVNLSLGGAPLSGVACQNGMSALFHQLWQLDIAPVVASGNTGEISGVMTPACDANAVAVAATYDATTHERITYVSCSDECTMKQCFCEPDAGFGGGRWMMKPYCDVRLRWRDEVIADEVASFSNTGPNLDFFAPGHLITTPNGIVGGTSEVSVSGTSFAAPHVAGAVAVVRVQYPGEPIQNTIDRLRHSGTPITDHRNGVTRPMPNLTAATQACPPSAPYYHNGGCKECSLSGSGCTGGRTCNFGPYTCDCPSSAPFDYDGGCHACPSDTPYQYDGACHECPSDAPYRYDGACNECPSHTPYLHDGACYECLNDSHCPSHQRCVSSVLACVDRVPPGSEQK